MKRVFKHLTLIVCVASLLLNSSCNNHKGEDEKPHTQTLIFYFAGTSLTFYYYKNISALKDALRGDIKGDSRVMLFFQQSEKNSGEIIELTYENGLCEEKKLATHQLPERMDADGLSHILKDIMRKLCAEGGAIFFSTHVLDGAEKLCNKVAIIRGGKLIAAGNTKDLTDGESLESVFMEVTKEC